MQKIRNSLTIRLALWVAGFVVITSAVVIGILNNFSEEVIRTETIDITLQGLENNAQRIDNRLRKTEMSARLEGRRIDVDRSHVERLIDESGYLAQLRHSLPHAQSLVVVRDSMQPMYEMSGIKKDYRLLTVDGGEMYVFAQPLGQREFCIVVTCPAEDIYNKYSHMHRVLLCWSAGGILLLLLVLYFVISRHLQPLHLLADAAQSIAGGNLDTPIPEPPHKHEIGRLQSSLKKMQSSLKTYMAEMQQKRATLSAHNAVLQAAYDDVQAYETMKEKFLVEMTAEMTAPVAKVCHSTHAVCSNYEQLSQAEMSVLQTDIMSGTENITELLDQLMRKTTVNSSGPVVSITNTDGL